jgi:flagellar biosynthesis anti-sigma factor FlgM
MRVDRVTNTASPLEPAKPGRAGQTETATYTANDASAVPGAYSTTDKVSLINQSRLRTLAAQVLAQPEVRQSKVEPLQQAIINGEFSIPPIEVADALLSEYDAQG